MAHPVVVLLRADLSKHELLDIPHLLEMFLPDVRPHLLAREYRSRADSVEIEEDELSHGQAELLKRKVLQLLSLLHDYLVGDVLDAIVTEIQQVFFVDVALAVFPDDLDVVEV